MLIVKLLLVPLCIAALTFADRRWGPRAAGMLGGLPVVAGPIVAIVAFEQGAGFAGVASLSAISAVTALLAFGTAYAWLSRLSPWPIALIGALLTWLLSAACLALLPDARVVVVTIAVISLLLTPYLLPPSESLTRGPEPSLRDLPYRMIAGALLTLAVTGAAASLGETWTGLLAVFPIIGLILAVFTHRSAGPAAVVQLFRGMVSGLYSFVAFFLALASMLGHLNVLDACAVAGALALVVQVLISSLLSRRSTPA